VNGGEVAIGKPLILGDDTEILPTLRQVQSQTRNEKHIFEVQSIRHSHRPRTNRCPPSAEMIDPQKGGHLGRKAFCFVDLRPVRIRYSGVRNGRLISAEGIV
jgi:hypothetical protein